MRKQLLGILVPLTAFVLIANAADMTGKGVATSSALQKLEVANSQDGLRVEFKAKGALAPKVTTLDSPARIVVDFPNTVMATAQSHISVGRDGVKDVRIGMDGQTPPSTRVVVDLADAGRAASHQHQLVAGPDGSFFLNIGESKVSTVASTRRQPAPVATPVAASAAPKLVMASAPVASSPVSTQVLPMPTASAVDNTQKPTDFAFVEPKFSVKPNTEDKAVEPAVKAQAAADRFADKTAAELIAANHTNAAMQATGAATPSTTPIQPAVNLAAEQKVQLEQKSADRGAKYTGEPISVNLKDVDLKDFFRLIHEISGLNVVLDPLIHGNLTIVLDDVPWDQALDIVLKNNDLSRQLDGNVLRIATVETLRKEAEGRRAQIDAEALAVDKVSITRFLSYAHAKDVLLPIKKFLSQRGDVVADERTNSLIVSDIPSVLPQIDRIIQQMDRKTQEVEIEARVVAATRSFARDIGVQLGLGWGNGTTQIGGVQGQAGPGTSPVIVGTQMHQPAVSDRPRYSQPDSSVFEPGCDRADQRSGVFELLQQRPSRSCAHDGGIARPAEDSFPSAHRHPEQHSGGRETGHENTDRDPRTVGWSAHHYLCGRIVAADRHSADHVGRHHLPQRGRGEYDPRL